MNCERFLDVLDATGPAALPRDAVEHATFCARCAEAIRGAIALDDLLGGVAESHAPEGFTDRVMARVDVEHARLARRRMWLHVALDPVVLGTLALALAALGAWPVWRRLASGGALARAWRELGGLAAPGAVDPVLALALGLAAAILAVAAVTALRPGVPGAAGGSRRAAAGSR